MKISQQKNQTKLIKYIYSDKNFKIFMISRFNLKCLYIPYKFPINYSNNGEIKINLSHFLHLFYNASQIKMVILVDLSAIFLAFPQSILASPLSTSVLFRHPIDLLLSSPVRQNIPIPNVYRMLRSFARTLPAKFH